MSWYRFEKSFQGGITISYIWIRPEQVKNLKYFAEEYGERSDGGHNYGYTVRYRKVKGIPTYALEKLIKEAKSRCDDYQNKLEQLELQQREDRENLVFLQGQNSLKVKDNKNKIRYLHESLWMYKIMEHYGGK